jgi:hypothetical protein
MKKYTLTLVTVTVLSLVSSPAIAYPTGSALNEAEYIAWGKDLGKWSFGAYFKSANQLADRGGFFESEAITEHNFVWLGYEVSRGVTPYLALGRGDFEFENFPVELDGTDIGIGVHFDLLDHDILDPFLMEDRIRIHGGILYLYNEDFQELSGALMLGLINDTDHTKLFGVHAIEIFGGILYSEVFGIDDVSTEDVFGFTAGVNIYLTLHAAIQASVDHFNSTEFSGGLSIRL